MKRLTGRFLAPWPLLALVLVLAASPAQGAEGIQLKKTPAAGRQLLTLDQAIALALRHNAAIKEAEADVDIYRAKQSQADAARWPQVEILGIVGPVPAARGNHLSSPDRTNGDSPIGIFQSARLSVIQPLFTFGLIEGLREASRGGVRVQQEGVRLKKTEIILKVHEYYYGAIAAQEVYDFLQETQKTLVDARAKLVKLINEEKGEEIDIFKLDAFSGELS
ncbi:MAG: TolC family protein, partial [bacterium]|nr:TolC family protein [bacterium]